MKKILLIIKREFIMRVRRRSFLLMSLIGPLMITGIVSLTQRISTTQRNQLKVISVVDESDIFRFHLPESKWIKFSYPEIEDIDYSKKNFELNHYNAILFIPKNISKTLSVSLYSGINLNDDTRLYIKNIVEKRLSNYILLKNHIHSSIINAVNSEITVNKIAFNKDGELNNVIQKKKMSVGLIGGMFMYFFIFMFGVQVMKATFEEKSNRIVEIILCSVKPFQLMTGKIIGIGLTGILQIFLKIIFTMVFLFIVQKLFFSGIQFASSNFILSESSDISIKSSGGLFQAIEGLNYIVIISTFILFFICGYLLYAAMFAVVGASIDRDSDTRQFIFPITLPLMFSVFIMIVTSGNPENPLSRFFSFFPLTSPIVMMSRIPFGVTFSEIFLSLSLLILSFIATTFLAGKIYKSAILLYGKKITYRDLWKWAKIR